MGRYAQGRAGCDEGGAGPLASLLLRLDKRFYTFLIRDRDLFHGDKVMHSTQDCKYHCRVSS